ncbi:MAG: CHAP domain-containing protein [Oscillospiraceae bacterium]|nr:CHAP domain-containing protein [Oscillospiraceae bacterium]
MPKDIKTHSTVRDIKLLDRSASGMAHVHNAFIKGKDAVDGTQQSEHSTAAGYASDKISGGVQSAAQEAANRLKNPHKSTANNVNKAKAHFAEVKRQMPNARKEAAGQANQAADSAQKTADALKNKADTATKTAQQAQKSLQDANRVLQQTRQAGRQSVQTAKQTGKGVKGTSKGTITTVKKSVKTVERSAKTTVKTAQKTAKSAQTAAKAAKTAAQASKAASKAAAQTAKLAAKAVIATAKAAIATIKGLVSIIAAGGWIAVVIIIVICVVALIAGSVFGVFFSGDNSGAGWSMPAVVQELANEIERDVEEIKQNNTFDETDTTAVVIYWPEVLAVYAVRVNTDPDNPAEVVTLDDGKIEKLRSILNDMVNLSHSLTTEMREKIAAVTNPDGTTTETAETVTVTRLIFTLTQKSVDEMAAQYGFSQTQIDQMHELLSPEYSDLWTQCLTA